MNRKKICLIIVCFAAGIALTLAIACLAIASALAEEQPSFITKDSLVVISTNNLREDGTAKNLLLYAKAGGYYTSAVADRIVAVADYDDVASGLVTLPLCDDGNPKTRYWVVNLDKFIERVDRNDQALDVLGDTADWLKNLPNGSFQTESPLTTAVDGFWQDSGVVDAIEESGWGDRLRDFFGTSD